LSEFQRNSEILSTTVETYDRPFSRVKKGIEELHPLKTQARVDRITIAIMSNKNDIK
jgi:hypothetical protein